MDVDKIIDPNEQVQSVVRQHWINIVPVIGSLLLITVVGLVGFYLLGRYGDRLHGPHIMTIAVLALLALMALGLVLAYVSWTIYTQNGLIITNKNVYQVTQNSLFDCKMSQFSLERLEDVSAAQSGMLANILNFGDVTIETAGEEENFVFRQAPNPRGLASWIMACHQQARGKSQSPSQPQPD